MMHLIPRWEDAKKVAPPKVEGSLTSSLVEVMGVDGAVWSADYCHGLDYWSPYYGEIILWREIDHSKELQHRGYYGSVNYCSADHLLYGEVMYINDTLTYDGKTVDEIKKDFEDVIDDYLDIIIPNRIDKIKQDLDKAIKIRSC